MILLQSIFCRPERMTQHMVNQKMPYTFHIISALTGSVALVSFLVWQGGQRAPDFNENALIEHAAADKKTKAQRCTATFAAGCYWCVESDFDKVNGVVATISGFMGGTTPNPIYKIVAQGETGHLEVVQVIYDPNKVSYSQLLDHYWVNVDPLDADGQFCDRGASYAPAIFVHDDRQRHLAEASRAKIAARFEAPVAVKIRAVSKFYRGPDWHQNYYIKNPYSYKVYRYNCARDKRLRQLWGYKSS